VALRGSGDTLCAVSFADGSERRLGAATAAAGPLSGEAVQVDSMGKTSVPGLSAAGDLNSQMPSVANAIAAGSNAAAMVVHGLMVDAPELASTMSGRRTGHEL